MRRRLALAVVVVLPLVAMLLRPLGLIGPSPQAVVPSFAALGEPTLPFVPKADFIDQSWFCGGVPVGERFGGSITVANPTEAPLQGRLTVFTDTPDAAAVERPFEVLARGTYEIDLDSLQPSGTYASALVELMGEGGFVEQTAISPWGRSISGCSNSTSTNWYFADNYTSGTSTEDLVITNPFPDEAILDFTFASDEGDRRPQNLQGFPVPGNSVVVVNQDNLPKDEAVLSVHVAASQGRVVVSRAQHYVGERLGYSLTLGAPSLSSQWTFADGEGGEGVAFERYSIYNPTDDDVVVTSDFWGLSDNPEFVGYRTVTVPAGRVVYFTTAEFEALPAGRHGMSFSTEGESAIVVERGITRRIDGGFATSVAFGAPRVFEGYQRWSMAVGSPVAAEDAIVVLNLDYLDGTVTVKALGPGGEQVIPGLEAVPLPKSSVIAISIPDLPAALNAPLIIESTQRIVVERLVPRGDASNGRTGSLALPG